MIPYLTGAVETHAPQRDPADSGGDFRSGTPLLSMWFDCADPMVGIAIRDIGGGNGIGVGTITAATADSLTWTEPGSDVAGEAVEIATGDEAILRGSEPGAWIRVVRLGNAPLSGAHAVTCLDRINNLFPDVATADAVAGLVTTRALMLHNAIGAVTAFEAWVGAGDIEIDLEEPTAGELLGSGISWSGATTEGAGPGLASVADDGEVGVWIRRTIAADAAPSAGTAWEVRYSFTSGGVDYAGAIRGRYRIEREDQEADGVWIGADAPPDLSAAADETWSSTPHTTSLALAEGAYQVVFRRLNKWGLWGAPTEIQHYNIDGSGESVRLRPSAPSEVTARQTSGNKPTVGALYDAAADGDDRAVIWVIWMETDGTDPDGSATPDGYELMQYGAAIDDLAWTSEAAALDDGTPVSALVRTRRLDNAGGTAFSPDVIQLADTGTGTLKVDAEISDWPASGYASVTTRFGKLIEVIHYSGIAVASGQTTVTVDERGLWGTTSAATSASLIVTPVEAVDSDNTAVAEWEIIAVAPGRPRGAMLLGTQGAQVQTPVEGPDGVTPVVLHAGENVHMILGEGWASLYVDTVLVWRVLLNGEGGEMNALYIPTEWDLVAGSVTGAAVDSGIIDAPDADTIYVCVRGQRRMKFDLSAMEITAAEFDAPTEHDDRNEQAGELERFGSTMFLCWDTDLEDYRPYLELDSTGRLTTATGITHQGLNQAAVEALW